MFFSLIAAMLIKNLIEFHTNPELNGLAVASVNDIYIVAPVVILTWVFYMILNLKNIKKLINLK